METIDLIVLMTLVVVLYIIIAVLKCVHHINVIKNWGRIEEILYTLPNHDENRQNNSSSPGSSQNQERTQSQINIEETISRTRRNISNFENNRIISRELTKLEIAPPPSYEESIKENRAVRTNSCSSLPTYEESLELV
jgi:hypothetical protein